MRHKHIFNLYDFDFVDFKIKFPYSKSMLCSISLPLALPRILWRHPSHTNLRILLRERSLTWLLFSPLFSPRPTSSLTMLKATGFNTDHTLYENCYFKG